MGQEQSYAAHANSPQVRKYQEKYEDPVHYRGSHIDYSSSNYEDTEYKRHKPRRSTHSFKSDHSTESSGYRSGSSGYECRSDRSSKSDYCTSLYKNDHYKDVSKELYRPVKITKDKRYMLQLLDFENENEIKSARLKSYLSDAEKANLKAGPTPKKTGIRNYTPKIISEEEQKKKLNNNWI